MGNNMSNYMSNYTSSNNNTNTNTNNSNMAVVHVDDSSSSNDDEKYGTEHWARDWMFGDATYDHHHFVETLTARAPKEVACAAAASILVSPLVSIIDASVVKDISSVRKFTTAVGLATRDIVFSPKKFFTSLSFRTTCLVYFGTYTAANLCEAVLDARQIKAEGQRKTFKVTAASMANVSLLMWRDSVFAKAFKQPPPVRTMAPFRTLGLFGLRDTATMYATFYLAPRAAVILQEKYGTERNMAELSSALAIPMAMQVVTAPIHIHAMHYYQVRNAPWGERFSAIAKEMGTVSFARSLRILPAFGIGCFSNNKFREMFIRQKNEELFWTRQLKRRFEKINRTYTLCNGTIQRR